MTELVEARMNGSDPGAIRAHDAPLCDARILQQVLARSPR